MRMFGRLWAALRVARAVISNFFFYVIQRSNYMDLEFFKLSLSEHLIVNI